MSGIFTTFNTAKRGMFAQQHSINTTSHNVTNANTEGYSRQRVQLETTPGYSIPGVGMMGTGVQISAITRIRDAYLDTQIRYETSIAGQYKARQEILEQVEMIFMEPSDAGLNTLMGRMWDSWQELSKSPENSNARTIVRENAISFTDNLNHMYEQLETLKNDSIELAEKKALDIHTILDQLQGLNNQIFKISIKGEKPNDLMDKRDLLLDQLSEIIDFKCTEDSHGRIIIKSGDQTLLNTLKHKEITQEISMIRSVQEEVEDGEVISAKVTLIRGGDSIRGIKTLNMDEAQYKNFKSLFEDGENIEGKMILNEKSWDGKLETFSDVKMTAFDTNHGELIGYQSIIEEVGSYQEELNNLAKVVAHAVNTIHMDNGSELEGHIAFFEGIDGTINASNIKINAKIIDDVQKINTGTVYPLLAEGDGERALAIAQLRNTRLNILEIIQDTGSIVYNPDTMIIDDMGGGTSFESYFKDIVAKLGISTQQSDRMVDNQAALTGQLTQRRDSISGVSLDEEIANLVQYQHAYQANSKVISTLTLMLDTLIHGMGL